MRGLLDFCDDHEEHEAIQRIMAPLLSGWSFTAHGACVELPMRGAATSSTDHETQSIGKRPVAEVAQYVAALLRQREVCEM